MKHIATKETLYDGIENQELYSTIFSSNNYSFKLPEILDNKIGDLKHTVSNEDFVQMASESGWQPIQFLDFEESYISYMGLFLYYVINGNLLHVYSFGERQPGRYVLTLEGVWENNKFYL